MYVKCWQCSESIDTISVEKQVYSNVINDLRGMLCKSSMGDSCDLDWRHEDCRVISALIKHYKEKI
jgi:hypothetical protein